MKLTKRQFREQLFHDKWAKMLSPLKIYYKESFESPTAIENQYIVSQISAFKSKHILDLGCGIGDASIYLALKGAKVTSIDISPQMIRLVNRSAKYYQITKRLQASVMPAEKLTIKNKQFDYIYGNGVLHHIDFLKAAKEIKRVLKKGGKGFFIEPLSYNPLIEVYRKIAVKVRTKDEKPLSLQDINQFGSYFSKFSHKEFHLTTLLIFCWFFIVDRISPNSERYWKKLLIDGNKYSMAFRLLHGLDTYLIKLFPFLARFCWVTVITVQN